jgi:CheY-like chemotaxis protein
MIRLLCVDDDPLVRSYLTTRLSVEPGMHVVGSASGAAEAFAYLKQERIDVVLLDYQLVDGPDGLQLLQAVSLWAGDLPPQHRPAVLFCTGYADDDLAERARSQGASGMVAKDRVGSELIPAVRAVAEGGQWFGTEIPAKVSLRASDRPWQILVAESDRPARAVLASLLPQLGCSVVHAWRGAEVISRLESDPCDLLLLDHRLPGMQSDRDVLDEVARRWPALPVLFLSAQPSTLHDYRPCSNVQGVLRKPICLTQLQQEVVRVLDWSERMGAGCLS